MLCTPQESGRTGDPARKHILEPKKLQILNGQISQIGNPEAVITEQNLKMAYGVDVRVARAGEAVERKVCFPVLSKQ